MHITFLILSFMYSLKRKLKKNLINKLCYITINNKQYTINNIQ